MKHLYQQIEAIFIKHNQQSLFNYWLRSDDDERERLLLIFTISNSKPDAHWQEVLDLLLQHYRIIDLEHQLRRNIRQLQRRTRRNKG